MTIEKQISMKANEVKPTTWYRASKKEKSLREKLDPYLRVRNKTLPTPPAQVIDPKTKEQRKDKDELRKKKHDWKRGVFDD